MLLCAAVALFAALRARCDVAVTCWAPLLLCFFRLQSYCAMPALSHSDFFPSSVALGVRQRVSFLVALLVERSVRPFNLVASLATASGRRPRVREPEGAFHRYVVGGGVFALRSPAFLPSFLPSSALTDREERQWCRRRWRCLLRNVWTSENGLPRYESAENAPRLLLPLSFKQRP